MAPAPRGQPPPLVPPSPRGRRDAQGSVDRTMVDRRATAPPAPKREARRAVGSAARLQADTPSEGVSAGEADLLREQVILPEGERSSAENERDSNRTRWRPPSASGKQGAELPVASVDLSSCDTWRRSSQSPKRTATRSPRRRSMRRWHPRSTARDKYVPFTASPGGDRGLAPRKISAQASDFDPHLRPGGRFEIGIRVVLARRLLSQR